MYTIAVLGIGQRGRAYCKYIAQRKDVKISAICDCNAKLLEGMSEKYKVEKSMRFESDEEFFKAGKLADALIIATMDKDHYRHAMQALSLGYHLLLEKPISSDISECEEITKKAEEKNLKVVICHVLRYSAYYRKLKSVIDSGAIGNLTNINHTENVAYWHFAHSYVRGNWHKEEATAPSILAKCCHDFDILYWLTGRKAESLQSVGKLSYFTRENAPQNSTEFCYNCPNKKTCAYSADKIYYRFTRYTIPYFVINWKIITKLPKPTLKDVKNSLKSSDYGKCVFKMDNDVFDHQMTMLGYGNGLSACLTMTAFSKKCYRKIHIYGDKGEIYGNDISKRFVLNVFGQKCKTVRVKSSPFAMHVGGDKGIVTDFLNLLIYGNSTEYITYIADSLESHRLALLAHSQAKENIKAK